MIGLKKTCKIATLSLSLVMVLVMAFSTIAFAAESNVIQDDRGYLVVNGEDIVYVGEDYKNSDTGEYFCWDKDVRGVDKSFSFKIRYSIKSSKFTVHSSKVLVSANAHVEDRFGNHIGGYTGHLYTVSIIGWYARNLQFSVGNKQSGTISGLEKGGSYNVQVVNNDYLPDFTYLVGSGKISTL